jgi:hypothetical protein
LKLSPAKITISRPHGGATSYISIKVHDESSHLEMLDIHVSLSEFAEALTGLARQECTYSLSNDPSHWGKVREEKIVPFKNCSHSKRREYLEYCARPHEVDGWKAQIDSALATSQPFDRINVSFYRYV